MTSYFMNKGIFKSAEESSLYKKVNLPSVTVSIPVYKSKGLLRKAVKHILTQNYWNFELLVISDNDPDNSINEILNLNDSRLKIIELKENIGRYAIDHLVVNELSNADYWVPVDSDDWCEENFLMKLMKIALKNPKANVVLSAQRFQDGSVKNPKKWNNSDELVHHAGQAALWKRDFVVEINLTNPNFRVGWDSIMTSVPWLFGNVERNLEALYNVVKRKNSLTTSVETGFRSKYRARVKIYLQALWKELVKNQHDKEAIKQILTQSRKDLY